MIRLLGWLLPLLLVLLLLVDLAFWDGVRNGPAGPHTLRSAQKEAPLALAYMHAGGALFGSLGLSGWTESFAERRVGQAYAEVAATPEAASDILMDSLSWVMRASHLAPPLLLLAWGLWYLLRPRQVRTIRRR